MSQRLDGELSVFDNPIKSHVLGVLLIDGCKRITIGNTKPFSDIEKMLNKYLPNDRGHAGLTECEDELIEAGYEDYAQI